MKKTAILVDGGFYRKVANHLFGEKSPEERADELIKYCHFHLKDRDSYKKIDNKKDSSLFQTLSPPFVPLLEKSI